MKQPALTILFANIYQGLWYEGKKDSKEVFSKYWPSAYTEQYAALGPDIICLAEAPLDTGSGDSAFIQQLAHAIGAEHTRTSVHDKSWLVEGKWYGNAIISRYPLNHYQDTPLPNPRFEYDQPDGAHWVLHDKPMQSATVRVGETDIRLHNIHYFPFQFFGHSLREPELQPSRQALVDQLELDRQQPTIVTGDFNNADDPLETAFPELFHDNALASAVTFGPDQFDDRYVGGNHQLDYILYSPRYFSASQSQIVRDRSDHRTILTHLEL